MRPVRQNTKSKAARVGVGLDRGERATVAEDDTRSWVTIPRAAGAGQLGSSGQRAYQDRSIASVCVAGHEAHFARQLAVILEYR